MISIVRILLIAVESVIKNVGWGAEGLFPIWVIKCMLLFRRKYLTISYNRYCSTIMGLALLGI